MSEIVFLGLAALPVLGLCALLSALIYMMLSGEEP
jgi:hypothetical protein